MLGFFLDFLEICFIVVPILAPIAELMDINMLWFAVLIAIIVGPQLVLFMMQSRKERIETFVPPR